MTLDDIKPKFIVDKAGKKTGVLLTMKEYKCLLDTLEDLEDVVAYDKAKAETTEWIPFDEAKILQKRENAA